MTEPVTKIEKCEPAAHTPGPWTSVDDSESSDLFDGIKFVIEGPPERQRGRVVVGQIATCNGERAKANARLIAQAPALLSHVEKSLCWMIGERNCYYEGCANPGSGYVHDADDRAVLDSLDRDIDELRALIAAARGEA